MLFFKKVYYKLNALLFREIRKNTNLIKINTAFSRGAATSALRKIDSTNPSSWEFGAFSQNGEDGIIDFLIENLKQSNKYFIEIGANNCIDNNTAWLAFGKNFSGLMIEGDDYLHKTSMDIKPWYTDYHNIFVTAENISALEEMAVYKNPDLFSLDIDGNDYYIMQSVLKAGFKPKIIVVEYNSCYGPDLKLTIKYQKDFVFYKAHESCLYYGVSISLWKQLLASFGYKFITVDSNGVNAFFVDENCFDSDFLNKINATTFNENLHQLRKFKNGWKHQFELIKHMPLEQL
jgi:hypothetical protein